MAENKTKPTKASVKDYLQQIPDEQRRNDCRAIVELMSDVTGEKAVMWGSGIIGFGSYNYKYERGGDADWMMLGFAPRKSDLTFYIMPGVETFSKTLKRLGKFKARGSCLYIKKLADVDKGVLTELLEQSFQVISKKRTDQQSKASPARPKRTRK